MTANLSLNLVHLYPNALNLYGDRGNIIVFKERCLRRGINLTVTGINKSEKFAVGETDLIFIGGGQDSEQAYIGDDLKIIKAPLLKEYVENEKPLLAVCGGYQLLANYYRPAEGPDIEGIGIFDAWTIHKGLKVPRCIGNIAIEWQNKTIVGFENHGGRTYLGSAKPIGLVLEGHGNNSEDKTEGAIYKKAFGTYIHGSLLPKNPHFADYLILLALQKKYSDDISLHPIDDNLEWQAHNSMLTKLKLNSRILSK